MATNIDTSHGRSVEARTVHERHKACQRVCRKLGALLADRIIQINELSEIKPETRVPLVYSFVRKREGQDQDDISKDPRVHAAALYMVYTIIELLQESSSKNHSFSTPLVTFRKPIYYDFMHSKILQIILEDKELCRICETSELDMQLQLMVITALERGLPEVEGLLTTSNSNYNLPIRDNDSGFINDPRKIAVNDLLLALCPTLKSFPAPYFPLNAHRHVMVSFARRHSRTMVLTNPTNTFFRVPTEIPRIYVEFKYLTQQNTLLGIQLVNK